MRRPRGRRIRGDRKGLAAAALDLLPDSRDTPLAAGHQHHREALAGEAPGHRRPESPPDPHDRRHLAVQVMLLCAAAQALPIGNSNALSDPGYISIE